MGGKPWQSKGCIDCRRRKIKCDEQRPECGRCIKRGLKCQGWEQHRNFVGAPSMQGAKNMKQNNTVVPMNSTSTILAQCSKIPALIDPGQATRGQVFGCFMERYIPSDTLSTVCFDSRVLCSIQNLPQKSRMTEMALSAISCLFLGRATKQTEIFNHGLALYNTAIRQMSNMLQRGTYTNELFYITFIFQELNVVYAPDGMSPWGTHVAGMNLLLNLYRAKANRDPIVDIICRYEQKTKIILASTEANLTESEYNYLMEPTNGDPLLEVLQIAVYLKDLKVALDLVNPHDLLACQDLLAKCQETHRKLTKLSTQGSLGQDMTECRSYFVGDSCIPSSEPLFGPAYRFSSLDNAMLFIMIWAHQAVLQSLISQAQSLVQFQTGSPADSFLGSEFEDMEFEDPEAYADRVARALPYCFRGSTKMACARWSMFGMCVASFIYFETGNREKHAWCRGVLDYMTSQGYDIAGFLSERSSFMWASRWDTASPVTEISQIDDDDGNSYLDYSQYRTLIRGS